MDFLTKLENQDQHVENIRTKMIDPIKVQLHTGLEGFDSPENFGIYRKSGGAALGVVGKVYQPIDLNVLLDSIVLSVSECCSDQIDINLLKYNEFKGGSKVSFELPLLKDYEIKASPMIGDIVKSSLHVTTGFDGLTKTSISFVTQRIWCTNGASRASAVDLSFKNTFANHSKLFYLCNEIINSINDVESYMNSLSDMAKIQVNAKQVDEFIQKVTGYTVKEGEKMTTRKRNILDKINQSVAIEMQNTGANLFSLYEGITRYTTHDLAGGFDPEAILYSNAAKLNKDALALANQLVYN